MVQITFAGRVYKGKQYVEMSGLTTDTKPTEGLLGGSLFWELDSRTIYALDEENELWIDQVQLSDGSAAPTLQVGNLQQPAVQQPGGFPALNLNLGNEEQTDDVEQADDPEAGEDA